MHNNFWKQLLDITWYLIVCLFLFLSGSTEINWGQCNTIACKTLLRIYICYSSFPTDFLCCPMKREESLLLGIDSGVLGYRHRNKQDKFQTDQHSESYNRQKMKEDREVENTNLALRLVKGYQRKLY